MPDKRDRFIEFATNLLHDRVSGKRVTLFATFLRIFSYLFYGIVKLRIFLYQKRVFRHKTLGCLIVVVGNLTLGGTGKTPVVERFARTLQAKGRKVAILSRGYMSKKEPLLKKYWRLLTHRSDHPPRIVSDGKNIHLDSENAGDEPYMLAKNLPGVVVLVDKNRVKAGAFAIKRFQVDTLILDDGFQYLPMKGQMNLLLIDQTNPFGNGALLPRGILREPISHLKRASFVFLTKSTLKPDTTLEANIKKHHPNVEIIACCHRPKFLRSIPQQKEYSLTTLKGMRIGYFCGIASPPSFEKFLEDQGAEIIIYQHFIDHHRFKRQEIERFLQAASEQKVQAIITTEKDFVRLPKDFVPTIPCFYLRMEIGILRGAKNFETAVNKVCFQSKEL